MKMDAYTIVKEIGRGSYGIVFQAISKITGEFVAIKKLKAEFDLKDEHKIMREVNCLVRTKHPNIVHLVEAFVEQRHVYFVFEYMVSDLYELIRAAREQQQTFSEDQIKNWCFQILKGLENVHHHGYFHRDLKPLNLLLSKEGDIKIADFGMSRKISSRTPLTEKVTTRYYRAPEVLLGFKNYGPEIDMWAVGATMAELYALSPLFPGKNSIADQMAKICRVLGTPNRVDWSEGLDRASSINYKFPQVYGGRNLSILLPGASQEVIDLIMSLCRWDPGKRLTASEALLHPFFFSLRSTLMIPSQTWSKLVPSNFVNYVKQRYVANKQPPPGFDGPSPSSSSPRRNVKVTEYAVNNPPQESRVECCCYKCEWMML